MIQGCDKTTSLTSLSQCNRHGVNLTHQSLHHGFGWLKVWQFVRCRPWFSYHVHVILINFVSILKHIKLKLIFCLVYLVYSGFNAVFLCAVYSIWVIKMLTYSLLVNYQDLPVLVHKQWTWNFQYCTLQSLMLYWNVSFISIELVKVNPDDSLPECINL